MSQEEICPVAGQARKFYRFCDDNHSPFSNENMTLLQNALQHPDNSSYPKDLRTLDHTEVHKRGDKAIQLPEFQNWLQSGYTTASLIWDSYNLDCIKNEIIASAEELLNRMKEYVAENQNMQQLNANVSNADNATVNLVNITVTPETIMNFAVKEK